MHLQPHWLSFTLPEFYIESCWPFLNCRSRSLFCALFLYVQIPFPFFRIFNQAPLYSKLLNQCTHFMIQNYFFRVDHWFDFQFFFSIFSYSDSCHLKVLHFRMKNGWLVNVFCHLYFTQQFFYQNLRIFPFSLFFYVVQICKF